MGKGNGKLSIVERTRKKAKANPTSEIIDGVLILYKPRDGIFRTRKSKKNGA